MARNTTAPCTMTSDENPNAHDASDRHFVQSQSMDPHRRADDEPSHQDGAPSLTCDQDSRRTTTSGASARNTSINMNAGDKLDRIPQTNGSQREFVAETGALKTHVERCRCQCPDRRDARKSAATPSTGAPNLHSNDRAPSPTLLSAASSSLAFA